MELCRDASMWLLEFQEANVVTLPWLSEPVLQQCWLPPSNQLYKVNVDGAIFKATNESGVGAIIRDANGLVVLALSQRIHAPLGPLEVEAKAFESGLEFAVEVGLQEFILEGDSLNVVHALQGLTLLNGNKPVHLLAKHAISIV
ncbi:uncharacterized protein LOC112040955 [Quercus suber]|uniref:uncharacterized protein LOC112040955 n=1 Tax=Quercus suber TaxID=58331 RepID=UPI000CE1DF17|nr:uncharacterized protein LOC112040955 [Quercus suber]